VLFTKQEIAHLAIDAALNAGVSPALVCAIIEISSGWNAALQEWQPEPWLVNSHPNDYPGGETEWLALGTRWGLMQFLGSKAHAAKYNPITPELIEPRHNLAAGCLILKAIMGKGEWSVKTILVQWYGNDRRSLVEPTLRLLPTFERFVRERPPTGVVAGKDVSDSGQADRT
jgi:hypothetical protein